VFVASLCSRFPSGVMRVVARCAAVYALFHSMLGMPQGGCVYPNSASVSGVHVYIQVYKQVHTTLRGASLAPLRTRCLQRPIATFVCDAGPYRITPYTRKVIGTWIYVRGYTCVDISTLLYIRLRG
jgi:hypothetical protein